MIVATLKGRLHCMKALIYSGASTELKDHHRGNTAVHIACNWKDEELLLALLDASVDLLETNSAGLSPLGVALSNRFYHLVPLLLEYGARLNSLDRQHLPQKLQEYIDNITGVLIILAQIPLLEDYIQWQPPVHYNRTSIINIQPLNFFPSILIRDQ